MRDDRFVDPAPRLAEQIYENTRELPPDEQREVLDFVRFLRARREKASQSASLDSLFAMHDEWMDEAEDPSEPEWSPAEIPRLQARVPNSSAT
jgi:hypothetical protein